MSWSKVAAVLAAVVVLAAPVSGFASDGDSEFGRSGPYVSGSAMYGFENFSGKAADPTPDNSWGYNLRGGYRFNEYFALEALWEQYVDFKNGGDNGSTDQWIGALNAKVYPFDGLVQPYVAAGLGWWQVNDDRPANGDDSGLGVRFGLGLDFYLSRNWALTTEVGYLLPTGGGSDYQVIPLSLGVIYRFY